MLDFNEFLMEHPEFSAIAYMEQMQAYDDYCMDYLYAEFDATRNGHDNLSGNMLGYNVPNR